MCTPAHSAHLHSGMLEAHTFAAGCLWLLSLADDYKDAIMSAGAPRYMAHLLVCKADLPRWHARQVLLNLSMVPAFSTALAAYDIPNFVTGRNVPSVRLLRPSTAPAALQGALRGAPFDCLSSAYSRTLAIACLLRNSSLCLSQSTQKFGFVRHRCSLSIMGLTSLGGSRLGHGWRMRRSNVIVYLHPTPESGCTCLC
jgi:hypothetical protein